MLTAVPALAIALCISSATTGQEVLQHVGALACLASAEDTPRQEDATELTCNLNLFGDKPTLRVSGIMYGRGLYLVEPGPIRVLWSVLAPVRNIEPTAIAGSYDTTSAHNFPHVQDRTDVLAGGMAGSIVLQLVTPTVDAIGPSTRLELRVEQEAG